jgi:hypothetical protein
VLQDVPQVDEQALTHLPVQLVLQESLHVLEEHDVLHVLVQFPVVHAVLQLVVHLPLHPSEHALVAPHRLPQVV